MNSDKLHVQKMNEPDDEMELEQSQHPVCARSLSADAVPPVQDGGKAPARAPCAAHCRKLEKQIMSASNLCYV